jgi:hypothetical protein
MLPAQASARSIKHGQWFPANVGDYVSATGEHAVINEVGAAGVWHRLTAACWTPGNTTSAWL